MSAPSKWNAFECLSVSHDGPSGVVFDVRHDTRLETANCPVCGKICELGGYWLADNNGYGSRGAGNDIAWYAENPLWMDYK